MFGVIFAVYSKRGRGPAATAAPLLLSCPAASSCQLHRVQSQPTAIRTVNKHTWRTAVCTHLASLDFSGHVRKRHLFRYNANQRCDVDSVAPVSSADAAPNVRKPAESESFPMLQLLSSPLNAHCKGV